MQLRPVILTLALLTATTSAFASSTVNFDRFSSHGKKSGDASYSIQVKNGIIKVQCEMNSDSKAGSDVINTEYQIGTDGLLDSGSLGKLSDKSLTLFTPSKTNDSLTIRTTKSHVDTASRTLALPKPDILIAFPNDPSIYQVLLKVVADHPHADNVYYLLVPAAGKTPDHVEVFRIAPPDDTTGKLNGKPITLKHYLLTFKDGTGDLYADSDGNLLQATLPLFNTTHIHEKFALDGATPTEAQ